MQGSAGKEVAEEIKEALCRRMGADRFGLWFGHGVRFDPQPEGLTVVVDGAFALERLRSRHLSDLQAAVREVCGGNATVATRQATGEEIKAAGLPKAQSLFGEGPEEAATDGGDEGPDKAAAAAEAPGKAGAASAAEEAPGKRARPPANRGRRRPRVVQAGEGPAKLPVQRGSAAEQGGSLEDAAPQLPKMTLRNFCVGASNELAHTATRMVIDLPGSASPVFFWGPPGTGKSHLLYAIRDELRRKHRMRRVIQLTAEDFTNDFTSAVRGSGLPAFRRRYRDVDALMVDDVQFFGGNKRATLRELQYTVDALIRTRKQLIFAGDRPPMEVDGLPSELAGRMAGGMVCSISPLDAATRRQVVAQFAAAMGMELPDELLDRIAESVAGDGRFLSGVVNYLRAFQEMRQRLPDWNELQAAAGDLIRGGAPVVGLRDIQRAVCETFGLPSDALQSRGQTRTVSQPRMLAMYLARQHTRAAFSEIGDYFGKRSHSTVIAATKRVETWLTDGSPLPQGGGRGLHIQQAVNAIENLLRTG